MTIVRYTVLVDRSMGDSDGGGEYHDGNGVRAVEQLARELQEGWNAGGISGHFRVTGRVVREEMPPLDDPCVPTSYEDDPMMVRRDYILRLINLREGRHPLDKDHIEIIKTYIREHPDRRDGLTLAVAQAFPNLWEEIHNRRTQTVTVRLDEILAGPDALKETFAKLISHDGSVTIRRYVAQTLGFSPLEDHPDDDDEDPVFRSTDDQAVTFLVEYTV